MAIEWIDGFDTYNSADMGKYYSATSGTLTVSTSGGRFTGSGYVTCTGTNASFTKNLSGNLATIIVGFALRWHSSGVTATSRVIEFMDSSNVQIGLYIDTTGKLSIRPSFIGTDLGDTGSFTLSSGTWYFVEVSVTINNTTGSATVNVDGTQRISLTNINTRNGSSNNYATNVVIGNNGGNSGNDYDDLYICNATTTDALGNPAQHGIIGPCRVTVQYPASDNTTNWTKSGGSNNYGNVSEAQEDNDTSYVSTTTTGQDDWYTVGTIGASPATIYAVAVMMTARMDDAGPHTAKAELKETAANTVQSKTFTMASGYIGYQMVSETNPHTNAAWQVTDVNAMLIGENLVS
jgi:hypothetical protein